MYIHEPTYLGTRLHYPDAKWCLTIKSQFNCAGSTPAEASRALTSFEVAHGPQLTSFQR